MNRLRTFFLIVVLIIVFYLARLGYRVYKIYKGPKKPENIELVQRDLRNLSKSASNYYQKPVFLGGGGGSFDGFTLNKTSLSAIDYSADSMSVINDNGVYHLTKSAESDTVYSIVAHPRQATELDKLDFDFQSESPIKILIGPSGRLENQE